MAFRSRYMLMNDNDTGVDNLNNIFPDCLTLPVSRFIYNYTPSLQILTEMDIRRFDIFIFNLYGNSEYSDIVLILNNVFSKYDLMVGDKLICPDKRDIQSWFTNNLK